MAYMKTLDDLYGYKDRCPGIKEFFKVRMLPEKYF